MNDNQHDYGWVVSCEYIDDDGNNNWDTIAGVFTNMDDANCLMAELANAGCYSIECHSIDENTYNQFV